MLNTFERFTNETPDGTLHALAESSRARALTLAVGRSLEICAK